MLIESTVIYFTFLRADCRKVAKHFTFVRFILYADKHNGIFINFPAFLREGLQKNPASHTHTHSQKSFFIQKIRKSLTP